MGSSSPTLSQLGSTFANMLLSCPELKTSPRYNVSNVDTYTETGPNRLILVNHRYHYITKATANDGGWSICVSVSWTNTKLFEGGEKIRSGWSLTNKRNCFVTLLEQAANWERMCVYRYNVCVYLCERVGGGVGFVAITMTDGKHFVSLQLCQVISFAFIGRWV